MEEPSEGVTLRGKRERMASKAGANHTNDASLKQPHTLITVDSDEIGGVSV